MTWMEEKLAARRTVHEAFGRAAAYYPTSNVSGVGASVSVRVHGSVVRTGDLDREGYSQVVEDVERIVFLLADVTANSVQRLGYVKMLDDGAVYRLDYDEPAKDAYTKTFQVVRV